MNAVLEQAQFDTVESALRFAFRQNRENYQASTINLMAMPIGSPGRGLGGLDGAGMAGIIQRHANSLGFVPEAILRCRYGQREVRCECGSACCKGTKPSEVWQEHIADLTSYSAAAVTMTTYRFRHAVIRRYFGLKVQMGDIARDLGIPQRTSDDHTAKIKQYLSKQEGAAFHTISCNLREAGIVHSAD